MLSGGYERLFAERRVPMPCKAAFGPIGGFFDAVSPASRGRNSLARRGASAHNRLPWFGQARKASALGADHASVKRKIGWLLLTFQLAVPCVASESTPLVRKRVSEVQFIVVATDQNNRPLPTLSPADIMVLEDGQPIQRFELRSATDLPLRIGVVLDLSDSTRKSWATVRSALIRSLQEVMRPNDELLLLAFNSKMELERRVADPAQLAAVLDAPEAGGLTALYDTLFQACGRPVFLSDREPHRSALILFSDGEDDLSLHSLGDAIARAQRAGVAIYTVATHNPKNVSTGDAVLRDLAAATGGRDFVVKDASQLAGALSEINDELRSSYLLYYRVPLEAGVRAFRRVHVIPTQAGGSHVRLRAGYYTAP